MGTDYIIKHNSIERHETIHPRDSWDQEKVSCLSHLSVDLAQAESKSLSFWRGPEISGFWGSSNSSFSMSASTLGIIKIIKCLQLYLIY